MSEQDERIEIGSVVQINAEHDPCFGACFMVVTEVKSWGVQGYVKVPGADGGDAYYRVAFDKVAYIGRAELVHADQA